MVIGAAGKHKYITQQISDHALAAVINSQSRTKARTLSRTAINQCKDEQKGHGKFPSSKTFWKAGKGVRAVDSLCAFPFPDTIEALVFWAHQLRPGVFWERVLGIHHTTPWSRQPERLAYAVDRLYGWVAVLHQGKIGYRSVLIVRSN